MRFIRPLFYAIVLCISVAAMSPASVAQVRISVRFGPPALPIYEQPLCPGDGYIWTPGYWAWGDDDYYWVPGTWVLAPEVGFLWTPPYWGWGDGGFVFYDGYWGPHVGFYGGIAYGFGYFGEGFEGGRWDNGHFFYNRSVTNVNITNIHNVYNTTIVHDTTVNRVSYNGGEGGITARPTPQEGAVASERHIPPVAAQAQHIEQARGNPELKASANHGKPPVAATAKPGEFREGAVASKEAGAPYNPPPNRAADAQRAENARPATPTHPSDLPAMERPAPANTGDPKLDKKYQQQQEKLSQQQDQERQKLQQRQDKEHQQMEKQTADDARRQQTEQKHQQQTQQLEQRHQEQQQQLQQKQTPRSPVPAKPQG